MPSFFVLNSDSTTTHEELQQAFGNHAMSRAQTFCWHKTISECKTVVEDVHCSGRPSTTRTGDITARVRELVRPDGRLSQNDC